MISDLKMHLITKAEGEALASEYERSNYAAINEKRPAKKPDSKSFCYDLEILQEYINLIREGMDKKGITNKGIRITLGKYPDNTVDERLDPIYKGYQTIFFSAENRDAFHENERSNRNSDLEDLPNMNYGEIRPPY